MARLEWVKLRLNNWALEGARGLGWIGVQDIVGDH
jgi:hypothetical protein